MAEPRTSRLRWTAAAFLVLLAAPGSARLQFDGLPFTRVSEVIILGITLGVLAHRDTRESLRRLVNGRTRIVNIALAVLTVGKVFTFAAVPFGAGFEACYRGLWEPRTDTYCEASWDRLWRREEGRQLDLGPISRVEPVIDFGNIDDSAFGLSRSNWNLPFANDFPRYQSLWLDRLPFAAEFAGRITLNQPGLVPVEYTGTIAISGAASYEGSSTERRSVVFLPLAAGTHDVRLQLTFRDDQSGTTLPDTPPLPQGPYARLHMGEPIGEQRSGLRLTIRGWAVDRLARSPVVAWSLLRINQDGGDAVTKYEVVERPDVATAYGVPQWRYSGFDIPINAIGDPLRHATFVLSAELKDGRTLTVARIQPVVHKDGPWDSPEVSTTMNPSLLSDVRGSYQFEVAGSPQRAVSAFEPSLRWRALISLIDVAQVVGLLALTAIALAGSWRRRRAVVLGSLLVVAAWVLSPVLHRITFLDPSASRALAVGLVLAVAARRFTTARGLLATGFGTALMLGPVIGVYRLYSNLGSYSWWGMQIFRDRGTDWLAFQGYARSILLETSLRGGENVFYFMPGMRYVAFALHILFGENDVFIGVLTGVTLVSTGLWLVLRVLARLGKHHWWWAAIAATAVISGVGRPISRELSAAGASEVVAWTLMFASCVVFVRRTPDGVAWTAASTGLAVAALLRPNLSVGLASILVALILARVRQTAGGLARATNGLSLVASFGIVGSLGLLHNLWYGQQAVVFTMRADPRQSDFPPIDLWRILVDDEIRRIAWSKVELLLHVGGALDDSGVFASRLAVILWISAVIVIYRRQGSRAVGLTLLSAPLVYMISTFPFGIMDTPERQIASLTVLHIATALGAVGYAQRPVAVRDD